jgi:hypothetical protein
LHVHLEEWFKVLSAGLTRTFLAANTILHGIQRVLSRVEQGLVEVPEIVSFNAFGFIWNNGIHVRIESVKKDHLKQIVNCSFDFDVLAHEEISPASDILFLQVDELIERQGF